MYTPGYMSYQMNVVYSLDNIKRGQTQQQYNPIVPANTIDDGLSMFVYRALSMVQNNLL